VEGVERGRAEVWPYCLMPNHVHVIAVPRDWDELDRAFRHVALNPVRARLVSRPEDWQ
jgi:REP element-mobilizing transposase RayT